MYETLTYEAAAGVGTLTLNRPDRLNGMTNRMVREAYEVLSRVAEDTDVRVLVLTGAGRGFCPGADLKHFTDDGAALDDGIDTEQFRAALLLHEIPQLTVAAINGACAGAGFGWACACDLRLAARSATFNSAFLAVAVAGDMGGPWTLPRIVGAGKARELYFLPDKFQADEALRIGLVNRVYDDEVFRAEVDAVVRRLAASAPLALRTMKANFLEAERRTFADYLDLESERHMKVTSSRDTREAFAAFVEKRTPQFEGR